MIGLRSAIARQIRGLPSDPANPRIELARDGRPYAANDPRLLVWVHVAGATSFLGGWMRYGEPGMSATDQDRYFAEMAVVAEMLGADPIPRSRADAEAIVASFLPELKTDERSRDVLHVLLHQRPPSLMLVPFQALTMNAAIELLPDWARRMHGLPTPTLSKPAIRLGTRGIAETVRWALRD